MGYPPLMGRSPTCYAPVRHSSTPEGASAFDLHVLSMPPTFILSQDQTLREIRSGHSRPLRCLSTVRHTLACFLPLFYWQGSGGRSRARDRAYHVIRFYVKSLRRCPLGAPWPALEQQKTAPPRSSSWTTVRILTCRVCHACAGRNQPDCELPRECTAPFRVRQRSVLGSGRVLYHRARLRQVCVARTPEAGTPPRPPQKRHTRPHARQRCGPPLSQATPARLSTGPRGPQGA